ncbi:MAG TPA: hypothetical protein PLU72_08960 [Candidatus Ozemobacteraceae bacterium]|nr:hypothetical protein [Candidatus Ozemobacteraceae bacterium]HQG27460.1 hypothetical protein [Candidatus Ozemobacteraceae bacterium]
MSDLNLRLFLLSPLAEKVLPLALAAILALVVFPLLFSPADPSRHRLRIGVVLGSIGSFLLAWQAMYVDHDEVEHLHSAWLMSQGLLPFRDFWQHHLPTLWILIAPATAWFDAGSSLVETTRLSCLLIAVVTGFLAWRTSVLIHSGKHISWSVFLFLWSAMLIPFQWNVLRPDLVSAPLVLTGLFFLLNAGNAIPGRFLAGLCLGAGLAFTPKLLPLVGFAGAADVLHRPFPPIGTIARRGLVMLCGVAIALIPLLAWLIAHDLTELCRHWAFAFNRKLQEMVFSDGGVLPLLFIIAAVVFLFAYRRDETEDRRKANIVGGCILGGALPMLLSPAKVLYHLQLAGILVLIAFAPAATDLFRQLAAKRRYFSLSFICVLFVLPAHSYTRPSALSPFSEGLIQMDILQAYSHKGSVSLMFPAHPILARNATEFAHGWLWEFLKLPILHEDLRQPLGSFTDQLLTKNPILIFPQRRTCSPSAETERHALSDHLLQTGFIGKAERDRLQEFLDRRYRLVNVMNGWFWLRNDIPEIY